MMQLSTALLEKAKIASKEFSGEPVPLPGLGGYYLAHPNTVLTEKDTRISIIGIDGVPYLIYSHLNGG